MNRHYIFLAMVALLLTGCGNDGDDLMVRQDSSVTFALEDVVTTRGTAITGPTFPTSESFRVFATKTVGGVTSVFIDKDPADVSSNVVSNTSGYWAPRKRYYWPDDDELTASFYAVYPTDCNVASVAGDVTASFTIPTDVSQQKDIMVAKTLGRTRAEGAVSLTFHHITSQISFSAKLDTAFTGWNVSVRGIRICNVNSRGSYSYNSDAVTPVTPAVLHNYNMVMAASTVAVTSTSTPVTLTHASNVVMLMPQTLAAWNRSTETSGSGQPSTTGCYLAVDCIITAPNGDTVFSGFTYTPLPVEWQKAKKYNYTLKFGSGYQGDGEPSVTNIALSCSISAWTPGEGATEEIIL